MDPDGTIYERSAILKWISENPSAAILQASDLVSVASDDSSDDQDSPRLLEVTLQRDQNLALVEIQAPQDGPQKRTTVVLVIDVSYSMDDAATMYKDSEGAAGLSILDVVKHSTRVVMDSLTDEMHQLAIVSYADSAQTVVPLQPMNAVHRQQAWEAVNSLTTRGSTNLWGGLVHALDLLQVDNDNVLSNAQVWLLTDGLPNIHPPRGELASLSRYLDSHPDMMDCTVSTFGFGFQLDSPLLKQIAETTQGYFGFIPDSSFVGTVFINAVSNLLSTAVSGAKLSLEAPSGTNIECLSGQSFVKTDWGADVTLPSLIYGQTMQLLFKVEGEENSLVASVRTTTGTPVSCQEHPIDDASFRMARARSILIGFIETAEVALRKEKTCGNGYSRSTTIAPDALVNTQKMLQAAQEHMASLVPLDNPISKDLHGQVTEAYSRLDWYKRWGGHYVNSLLRAHILQQCSNFKDPGVQIYATPVFNGFRDRGEAMFCKLPPPKPSRKRDTRLPALRSMSSYYDSRAPCFASGRVLLEDGSRRSVEAVEAGSVVMTSSGLPAKVVCVIATRCDDGVEALVELEEGVVVTPWHPVRKRNSSSPFQFPAQLGAPRLRECETVYSFVLQAGATDMIVGDYEAVTLGHGIRNDPTAAHAYLGSKHVVDDLSRMVGWEEGRIELDANPAVRDPETHRIVKFRQFRDGKRIKE